MAKKNGSKVSKAAKELSDRGASQGGRARASKLSPQERSEIAQKAAAARWNKDTEERDLPKALCGGGEPLRLGEAEILCYVLEEGCVPKDEDRRVIRLDGFQRAIGMRPGGGTTRLADFGRRIAPNSVAAEELSARLNSPVEFVPPNGGTAKGYSAMLLVDLCDCILEARRRGKLTDRYTKIADASEIVMRGFANIGIIALIDEATGYQEVRRRLALAEILDQYLDDKLNQWTKTFPDEFYVELFRLKGWDYTDLKAGDLKPAEVGQFTKNEVYRRLHPGIVTELESQNPYVVPGRRLYKHHQWLTREIGHPTLQRHIDKVITVMKLSDDWLHFMRNLQKALPKPGDTEFMDFIGDVE